MTSSSTSPAVAPAPGATMSAIVQREYGTDAAAVLRPSTAPVPSPEANQVLVRIHATSVDQGTWHLMAGLPYPVRAAFPGIRRPRRLNPGLPLAGTVVAVGEGVRNLRPGDRVFGEGSSTLAQYAVADRRAIGLMPAGLSFPDAAAAAVSGVTALQAVRDHAGVAEGERVLVLGAGGGVGSYAVQLAKAAGASVTAVCSTGKVEAVHTLGPDEVIDYRRSEPTGRYDVILDTGGMRPLPVLRRLLTERGRLVIVGGENGGRWLGGSQRQVLASLLSPFVRQSLGTFMTKKSETDLVELGGLLERGVLRSLVESSHPLADAAEAMRRLTDGAAAGKVVVTVD
ncbi:NAD(P)-dependent alcohol dehydrogenase [Herbiconiux sp. SYSU D00978]|uniref:NAD(P)-dependent alcohol dehydrogenase n=1 Tax=Herbiconiux sp. SYSU D00978 TaxID=2812562 RepID=UPI001A970087|nr:NAD(P)-dependent alcohol dehydrogenase [Herbiconiux sp. SYSU D00978]